jgi:serine protease Do
MNSFQQGIKGSVRRLTWLLLGFFLAVAWFSWQSGSRTTLQQVNHQQIPVVVAPEGAFLEVYEASRPATLKIEARVDSIFVRGPYGVGTGFFISADGLVLTAYHVVDTSEVAERYRQELRYIAVAPDETEYELTLIGFDAYLDLAILQATSATNVPFLPLAERVPRVGNEVVAIGNSREDFLQPRAGTITKIGVDSPQARFADETIQLTAALAPGDSGGPVINNRGEAIGVVSYIAFNDLQEVPPYLRDFVDDSPGFSAYAASIGRDSEVIQALIQGARRDIPVIGFSSANFDYDPKTMRDQVFLGRLPGAVVGQVAPDSPAEKAGLRSMSLPVGAQALADIEAADVIVAVDSEATPTMFDLIEALYLKGVGETVTITVQRGSQTFKLRLELGAKRDVFN